MVKNDKGNTLKDNIINILKMRSVRKWNHQLQTIQSIYNDEFQVLRKELESKNNIINNLI